MFLHGTCQDSLFSKTFQLDPSFFGGKCVIYNQGCFIITSKTDILFYFYYVTLISKCSAKYKKQKLKNFESNTLSIFYFGSLSKNRY